MGDKDTACTSNSELIQADKALMSWESKLEIKLQDNIKKTTILFWRYVEAVINMIDEYESINLYEISKIVRNKIFIRITQYG